MSDTPLVDQMVCVDSHPDDCVDEPNYVVDADFARDLERDRAMLIEALKMVMTYRDDDGQCDNGYTPRAVAIRALKTVEGEV
jgi:hypothetical protein